MVTTRIIPDAYTEYEDGHIGTAPGALSNVEAKFGSATGGIPGHIYTLSGADGKKNAKTVFKSGPLLKAIEEAFDSGSSRIYASRIGTPVQATKTIKDMNAVDAVTLKGDYGLSGNNHYYNVSHQFLTLTTGYAAVLAGATNKVVFYDDNFTLLRSYDLEASDLVTVVGLAVRRTAVDADEKVDFWVLGIGPAPDSHPMLLHYDGDGVIIAADSLDLDALIPIGDAIQGLGSEAFFSMEAFEIVTDKTLLYVQSPVPGTPILNYSIAFTDLGIVAPDIRSMVLVKDINAYMNGEGPTDTMLLVDGTALKIYGFTVTPGEVPVALGEVDISTIAGADVPESLAVDYANEEVHIGFKAAAGVVDRVVRVSLDWAADPTPTVTVIGTKTVARSLYGLSQTLYGVEVETTLKIQDRNDTPWTVSTYRASGTIHEVTTALLAMVTAGGKYTVEVLTTDPIWLLASGSLDPDPDSYTAFSGGSDGAALTNADYLSGLETMKSKLDINWIHAVGANTNTLWTAILAHCTEMFENYASERFAILETPAFSSGAEPGTAAYLAALDLYVESIVTMADLVGDRNAVIFAGGGTFLGSDGVEYTNSIVASAGGVMADLAVQKSLINKIIPNALALVPEFGPGHIETLIQARVNCARLKSGRGYVLAHSLTAAAEGSDYSRVNDLRAVYYFSKAAREAGQVLVGEENDAAGEGLRRLESAMSKPLKTGVDNGQIDSFDLKAVSTAENRLLGDVYVTLGIQPRRAMEKIYVTVYLQ